MTISSREGKSPVAITPPLQTHEVANQTPPMVGYNVFTQDQVLVEAMQREGAGWAYDHCAEFGAIVASERVTELTRLANKHIPELKTHDRFGNRVDFVEFHPAYHALMSIAFGSGVHSFAYNANRPGGHVARAALCYLWNQAENGTSCPTGMAYAAIAGFQVTPWLSGEWLRKLTAQDYDPSFKPASEKRAITVGYAMTEKQGGSDLRANTTTGKRIGHEGDIEIYELTGHKWFFSAPMSDGFFTTAQTKSGISCFFVPRWKPDGTRNTFFLQRIKDKCGNRSNASSEMEYANTWAVLVGEEGRGVRAILESADYTRLDFAIGSAALLRQALNLAIFHAEHRKAFGKRLIEHPMMKNTLADLALESEAATALAMRLAAAIDRAECDESERLLARILTAVGKYWNCKRAPVVVEEALECIGGNGFIEEHPMARLYREAPINTIWEGTSNMMCMDVLRAFDRMPGTLDAVLDEIRRGASADTRIGKWADEVEKLARDTALAAQHARQLTKMIALGIQASIMARSSPGSVAAAFLESRLEGGSRRTFGTLASRHDLDAIVGRSSLTAEHRSHPPLEFTATQQFAIAPRGELAKSLDEVTRRAIEETAPAA
ncbi:MAG: acyl-CoA dehydrogenase family protein [Betaproteobacteria bacterium]|nr:acyl-CoA dehydrogenase family protein [Betaproteobacteria bacterium]